MEADIPNQQSRHLSDKAYAEFLQLIDDKDDQEPYKFF
ncbi:hypothetical protein PBI_MIMI_211 [Arthrobacter phage Mimi]|nr:hypothetical protein PBI_MIMI_5 [Arthrobacter phage Mimi]